MIDEGRVAVVEREPTAGETGDVDDAVGVEEPSRRQRALRSLRNLAIATVAVSVVALLSGWLFARSAPSTAAATSISALVEDLPPQEDAVAPEATCGSLDAPADPDTLAAARAAGVVTIRYRSDAATGPGFADLTDRATALGALIAPDEELGSTVVEVSSAGHRMPLDAYDDAVVRAYLTAYADPDICA